MFVSSSIDKLRSCCARGQCMPAQITDGCHVFSANDANQTYCPHCYLSTMLFQYSLAFLFFFFLDFCWYLLLSFWVLLSFFFCLTSFSFVVHSCYLFLCIFVLFFPFKVRVFRLGVLFCFYFILFGC